MPLGMEVGLGPGHIVLDGDATAERQHSDLTQCRLGRGLYVPPYQLVS